MGSEQRSMIGIILPEEDMAELKDAARRRRHSPGHEARLWMRSKAQEYRAARIAAGEELWTEPERPTPTPPVAPNRPWEN